MWEDEEKEKVQNAKKSKVVDGDDEKENSFSEKMTVGNITDSANEKNEKNEKKKCNDYSENATQKDEHDKKRDLDFIKLSFENKIVHIDRFGNIITSV